MDAGLESLAGLDPELAAGFFRRHKVRLRVAWLLEQRGRPELEPFAARLAPHVATARARQQVCDEVVTELGRAGLELGFAVYGIKGLVSRTLYPEPCLRDLGDSDIHVVSDDQAWQLAQWLRRRDWEYDERELPWFKREPESGCIYGQIRLVRRPQRGDAEHFADIHYGGYSVRHCGLYRFTPVAAEPGWHLISQQQNYVLSVANAAGDDFITLKDLNDLYLICRDGIIDLSAVCTELARVGLANFFATMVYRLTELFDLSAIAPAAREFLGVLPRAEPVPPLFAPDGHLRRRVTVAHAFRTGMRHSAPRAVVSAVTAARYYSSKLELRATSSRWRHRRLPPCNSWTCVRLVPVELAARKIRALPGSRPPVSLVRKTPDAPVPGGFRFLRLVNLANGDLILAGDEAFIPTVYYVLRQELITEACALELPKPEPVLLTTGARLPRGVAAPAQPVGDVLTDWGIELPNTWYSAAMQAGPVTINVAVSDKATGDAVFDELVPPWDLRSPHAGGHASFLGFAAGRPVLPVRRRKELAYGNRVVEVADWGPVRTGEFSDSGSLVIWDSAGRCAVMVMPVSRPAIDVRDVLHRQLVQPALQRCGFILMHGAGLATRGGGILITGQSGAGKTSLQLDLARALGVDLLGGGRIYLDRSGTMLPYPGRFVIGTGLMANRLDLGALTTDEPDKRGKITVPTARVAAALGVGVTARAPLRLVLVPRLDPGTTRLSWKEPVSASEAQAILAEQCLSPDDRWPNWLQAFPDTDRTSALAIMRAATAGVPVLPVRVPVSADPLDRATGIALLETWLGEGGSVSANGQ